MPITVKHAPSAEAIGETAYTVGKGQRRERDIALAWDIRQRQQALGLQARGQELGAERSAEQLALQREGLEFRRQEAQAGREFAERRWQEEPSRQLERGLQEQQRLQKNIAWQYDEGQKRELSKITTGIAWIRSEVAAGRWTAEQGEQAEQQLWQKYYSIIPLPVYDDQPKPQEMFNSGIVTHSSGRQYIRKANGDWEPLGPSFKDRSKLYADVLKVMFTTDPMTQKDTTDYDEVLAQYNKAIVLFTKEDELATRMEEIQKRQAEQGPPRPSIKQEATMRADVLALPKTFKKLIEEKPEIGRKKKGKTSRDKVYGEEAYNRTLVEAIEENKAEAEKEEKPRIHPEEIKAELDKWWDAKYQEEKGDLFQKYANRLEFQGAAPQAAPEAGPEAGLEAAPKAAPVTQLNPIWPQLTDEQRQVVWQAWKEAQVEGVSAEEFGKKAIILFGKK